MITVFMVSLKWVHVNPTELNNPLKCFPSHPRVTGMIDAGQSPDAPGFLCLCGWRRGLKHGHGPRGLRYYVVYLLRSAEMKTQRLAINGTGKAEA
jgi:hypothetical protein